MTTEQLKEPSLNGHYCLATKEHYEKLIEDGCEEYTEDYPITKQDYNNFKFLSVDNGLIYGTNHPLKEIHGTPMHLHNNEWIIGSLEHEEINPSEWQWKTITDTDAYYTDCKTPPDFNSSVFVYRRKPKVERITREEAYRLTDSLEKSECTDIVRRTIDFIFDNLEANQKDK